MGPDNAEINHDMEKDSYPSVGDWYRPFDGCDRYGSQWRLTQIKIKEKLKQGTDN